MRWNARGKPNDLDISFMTILSIKWTVTITFIFFMLKETTSESTISIKMNEATTTNTESKLNYS